MKVNNICLWEGFLTQFLLFTNLVDLIFLIFLFTNFCNYNVKDPILSFNYHCKP